MKKDLTGSQKNCRSRHKILLVLLPYWTPQIPPLGISCLKGFLQEQGFEVKTADANIDGESREIYDHYFDTLKASVSQQKRGNFYNIGHEVLQNHMMAHLHFKNEEEYIPLVKTLIFKTFFIHSPDEQVRQLNKIVERFYTWLDNYFLRLLNKEQPSVLGLSVYKGNLPASMFAFNRTKMTFPHITTVMGGAVFAQTLAVDSPNFHYFSRETAGYIDKIIIGEGEYLFLKLLQGELPESQRVFTSKDIDDTLVDLSTVPLPDFSDLDRGFYPILASYTSRSCPFQCTFCTETVFWGKYRRKKIAKIVSELSELYKKYRFQLYFMCDSLLNPVITKLAEELIKQDLSLYWDGYLRVDEAGCNMETTMLWRRGGFYRARLGVESGSQRILDLMGKKVGIQQVKTAVSNLANAGIKTTTYWIIGYPGETEEDFQMTLDLVEELRDDIYEAECNPFGFYFTGQVNSNQWRETSNPVLLYPESAAHMLILQTWIIDCPPSREETFNRVRRFVEHCTRLGIANPYSLYDISKADERWKKLHKNAVPSLVAFKNQDYYIDENKNVKIMIKATDTQTNRINFSF